MFDELRDSLRAFSSRLDPDERRRMSSGMREAIVHAKLAVNEMRAALTITEQRLRSEQTELDTVRRRQGLAADIGDHETVAIAERFAAQHAERVTVLESKHMVQQQELALAEREYESMSADLRRVMSGLAPEASGSEASSAEASAAREVDALLGDEPLPSDDPLAAPPASRRTRSEREADADARLADLKRKLGR
jgi:multidrug resistance efflux pump